MVRVTDQLLADKKVLHFIGVGGSGMFPIVQIMSGRGFTITGSDNNPGDTIDQERQMGVRVDIGHHPDHIKGADLVVYSAAIMQDNPELVAARAAGIPVVERAEMLGYLTRQFDDCIGVSGTHGKTTTTSLLTLMLLQAGLDPSAVIGGKLPAIGGSGRAGKSEHMVCEACEFSDTFLHLSPDIAVILNVDADHLEYFGSLENIIHSFSRFAQMATRAVVYNQDDANTLAAVGPVTGHKVSFGWGEGADYRLLEARPQPDGSRLFDLRLPDGRVLRDLVLHVPGEHNLLNAAAAIAAAFTAGADEEGVRRGLELFYGAGRRFEILGKLKNGATVADDYAHHPAELKATLTAARQLPYQRVWAVFQPFTFSRTALLMDDFAAVLPLADRVVLTPIMGGREVNTYGVHAEQLAQKIPGSVLLPGFEEIAAYLLEHTGPGDLVITLGCGDVYKCAKLLLAKDAQEH